jgi:hypothetical protein
MLDFMITVSVRTFNLNSRRRILFSFVWLLVCVNSICAEEAWLPRADFPEVLGGQWVYKQAGNLQFTFNDSVDAAERSRLMDSTRTYLKACLSLLHEATLNDTVDFMFVRNWEDMRKLGFPFSGYTSTDPMEGLARKTVFCVGGPRNPLKHEVMHLVSRCRWGPSKNEHLMTWLEEGLATFANPEAECDTLSFEEKYRYFLQNGKAIDAEALLLHFKEQQTPKISHNQSAYIVCYLVDKYGIDTLRKLWVGGMEVFQELYGMDFNSLVQHLERQLMLSSQPAVSLDWNDFIRPCY